ncbi:hypothetical protein [Cystobacter fuscus]|uniref:hypothetical protein n=1 Tax=Cystobacter fuscus TaxID=43 RepID=UPI0037C0B59B
MRKGIIPCRSAIEHKPTYMIAQPLVVKHKLPDFVWKLLTLPLAFLHRSRCRHDER